MNYVEPLTIIKFRRKMGWTQDELAQQLGCNKKTVSKWENGHTEPKGFLLKQLIHIIEENTRHVKKNPIVLNKKLFRSLIRPMFSSAIQFGYTTEEQVEKSLDDIFNKEL